MRNKEKIILFSIFLVSFISFSCTSTDAYTTVGENISKSAQYYDSIIAYSNLTDNKSAHTMENEFLSAAREYGIDGYAWLDLFPPLREYDTDEIFEILADNKVNMVVYLTLEDSDTSYGVSSSGNSVYTYTTGQALYTFTFFPLDMNEPILVTQINAQGDEFSSWDMINKAAAKRAMKEYAEAAGIEPLPSLAIE